MKGLLKVFAIGLFVAAVFTCVLGGVATISWNIMFPNTLITFQQGISLILFVFALGASFRGVPKDGPSN
jgi:hypothetical protein